MRDADIARRIRPFISLDRNEFSNPREQASQKEDPTGDKRNSAGVIHRPSLPIYKFLS